MARPQRLDSEHGFTIIEVMVAAVILLVGILGVTTIVNTANSTATSNKAREQGLSLAREVIESSRSIRYQSLRPSTVVAAVQNMGGFADSGAAPGWQIKRRGITYSVSVGVCSVDDPGDGTGAHVADSFCARSSVQAGPGTCRNLIGTPAKINGAGGSPGADGGDCGIDTNLDGQVDDLVQGPASACAAGTSVSAGTCDAQPDDFKRLVTLITWDRGAGSRYVLQQATAAFPGLSAYGAITKLELNDYSVGPNGYTVDNHPSSLSFKATSSQAANQVNWLLGGVDRGPFATWSGTEGTFTWDLGGTAPEAAAGPATSPVAEVLDGGYFVGARVQDAIGIHGTELDVAVTVNRRTPFAPGAFAVADNRSTTGGVRGTWSAPPDRDVIGYRMYRKVSNATGDSIVCDGITVPSCTDPSPPNAPTVTYWVVALDRDSAGQPREGHASIPRSIANGNAAPTAPTNLAYTLSAKKVTLTWNVATDSDGTIQRYEIYRDGAPDNFSANASPTYFEQLQNNQTYKYKVRAIDNQGLAGPFSAEITVST